MNIVTVGVFIFQNGILKFIPTIEDPWKPTKHDIWTEREWKHYNEYLIPRYNEAVAYAREHPVVVRTEDVEKIKWLIKIKFDDQGNQIGKTWQPQDLTEYKLEGVRMEIKEVHICETCNKQGLRNCGYFDECGAWETKQIACLIEDDKGVNGGEMSGLDAYQNTLEDDKQ